MIRKHSALWAVGLAGVFMAPAPIAATLGGRADTLGIIVSAAGLGIALVLMIEAWQVRRLATGGAIAERISLVILATICLAASALLSWAANFMPSAITADEASFGARLLVIAAMGLLAAYFFNVRAALQRFMEAMTGAEVLDAIEPEPAGDAKSDPEASDDDSERMRG